MSIAKRDDAKEIYARIIQTLLILLIPLAFLFWSVSDVAILLFSTREYLKGENIIILIVIQHILILLYQCVGIGLTLKRKTIFITIGYSIAGILVVLLSFPLCKYFGILGAALSVFIGYLIAILYIFYKSNQFYPIPYNRKFILAYLLLTLFILCFTLIIPNSNLTSNFIIRFVIGCCYMGIPFVCKIVSIQDIKNFISIKK
jgi:O-antigen/teichoic acid export membrane protein